MTAFCLICLSNSAGSFPNITEFKALNAVAQLFDAALRLLEAVFASCTVANWHLLNRGSAAGRGW